MRKILAALFVIGFFVVGHWALVFAESCSTSCSNDNLDKCMAECQKLIDISINATKPHEQTAQALESEIASIDTNITALGSLIDKKKAIINIDEQKFAKQQKYLDSQVRDYYKSNWTSPVEYFLVTALTPGGVGDTLHYLGYHQSLINQQKKTITSLVLDLSDLQKQKKDLEDNQNWLAAKQISLATTLAPIKKLVADAKAYQSQLNQTVGSLSARQQQLLAEKTGGVFSASVGNVAPSDDPNARPNFDPGVRPAFAGFSFGIPHRLGMSQYGAYGRAKSGQKVRDILHAYYSGVDINENYSLPGTINVCGYGNVDFNSYMKGIGEMPNSWGDQGGYDALMAQAVAARSYALSVAASGRCIQPTEGDQVYLGNEKGGNSNRAVDDTKNWVMTSGGSPVKAFYSASDGGYTLSSSSYSYLRSVKDVPSGSSWPNDAYENTKYANSPFFYLGCYRPRCLASHSASRNSPWLTQDEFVDIVNSALLYKKDSGTLSHISQLDKSNSDVWDKNKVRDQLGDPVSSVDRVWVDYNSGGFTDTVHFQTDRGQRDINGETFRTAFNTRAPGEIWIASSLFNIEKK